MSLEYALSSQEMSWADQQTIEGGTATAEQLMERAGSACFQLFQGCHPRKQPVAVLAGKGNNGGDAFVVASLLQQHGYSTTVFAAFPESTPLSEASSTFLGRCIQGGIPVVFSETPPHLNDKTTAIIDGLLGTGLSGAPRAPLDQWIRAVNDAALPVFSLDLPSGLYPDADASLCIKATHTMTFQRSKIAHWVNSEPSICGRLVIADIGILTHQAQNPLYLLHHWDESLQSFQATSLMHRPAQSHKGNFGSVGVIGGASGMEGAAALAGLAALRSGCGKVNVFTPQPFSPRLHHSDLMVSHWRHAFERPQNSYIAGPGMGQSPMGTHLLKQLLAKAPLMVLDADGLNVTATHPEWHWGTGTVFTPHPGEAATLLGRPLEEVRQRRWQTLHALCQRFPQVTIVLKGHHTLIGQGPHQRAVVVQGTPALAVAGSGDILSGIIGAYLAQGLPPFSSACLGTLRHALLGTRYVQRFWEGSALPSDLLELLKEPPPVEPPPFETFSLRC
jgi:NAD(P)H-hydrate epimerase